MDDEMIQGGSAMIEIDSGLLAVLAFFVAAAFVFVMFLRAEQRRDAAWFEHMERIGRRCPACQPWGGWYLGAMKPDGGYEIVTCEVCNGTGEVRKDRADG